MTHNRSKLQMDCKRVNDAHAVCRYVYYFLFLCETTVMLQYLINVNVIGIKQNLFL